VKGNYDVEAEVGGSEVTIPLREEKIAGGESLINKVPRKPGISGGLNPSRSRRGKTGRGVGRMTKTRGEEGNPEIKRDQKRVLEQEHAKHPIKHISCGL